MYAVFSAELFEFSVQNFYLIHCEMYLKVFTQVLAWKKEANNLQ